MISPDFVPVWSGIGSYTIELLRHVPSNVEVDLLTVKRQIPGKALSSRQIDDDVLREIKDRVRIHYISEAYDTFAYHLRFQLACMKTIPRICRMRNIDLVHANFPLMSDILVKLTRMVKISTSCTIQSTIDGQHLAVKKSGFGLGQLEQSDIANLNLYYPLRMCEWLYVRKTDYFVAISQSIRREMQYYLSVDPDRIRVIYHGVDCGRFHPDIEPLGDLISRSEEGRPIVLYTGRLVASKGIDTLIGSIPRILRAFPDTVFVIAGGGKWGPYLHMLEKSGVPKRNLLFRGYVDFLEMPHLYVSSTIYVAPTTYEPLGIRILEAMSCSKPVVATSVGGIPEIISHKKNGLLVAPYDSVALSDAVIQLLGDPSLVERLGKSARKAVIDRFSAAEMAQKTFDYFREIAYR